MQVVTHLAGSWSAPWRGQTCQPQPKLRSFCDTPLTATLRARCVWKAVQWCSVFQCHMPTYCPRATRCCMKRRIASSRVGHRSGCWAYRCSCQRLCRPDHPCCCRSASHACRQHCRPVRCPRKCARIGKVGLSTSACLAHCRIWWKTARFVGGNRRRVASKGMTKLPCVRRRWLTRSKPPQGEAATWRAHCCASSSHG